MTDSKQSWRTRLKEISCRTGRRTGLFWKLQDGWSFWCRILLRLYAYLWAHCHRIRNIVSSDYMVQNTF